MRRATLVGVTTILIAGAVRAAPTTYTIDPTHTSVTAESRHFGTSTIRSRFMGRSGSVTIDPAAGTGSAIVSIDMTSVTTGVPKLDDQLRGAPFFDAATYPDATFNGTRITFDGERVASITGELTMHGVTAPLTLTSTHYACYPSPNFMKQVCGGDFEATIRRSTWGVGHLVPIVSDETKLKVQIEAVKD